MFSCRTPRLESLGRMSPLVCVRLCAILIITIIRLHLVYPTMIWPPHPTRPGLLWAGDTTSTRATVSGLPAAQISTGRSCGPQAVVLRSGCSGMATASAAGSGDRRPGHRRTVRGRQRHRSRTCAPCRPMHCHMHAAPRSHSSPASRWTLARGDAHGSRRHPSAPIRCAAAELSVLIFAALAVAAPRAVLADANASCAHNFAHCNDFQCQDGYKAAGCTNYTGACTPPCNAWAASNLGGVCDQSNAQSAGRWFAGYTGWNLQVSLTIRPPSTCCLSAVCTHGVAVLPVWAPTPSLCRDGPACP